MLPVRASSVPVVTPASSLPSTHRRRRLRQRGVSLVEISTVVTITGILATLATYSVRERINEAHSVEAIAMLGNIRSGLLVKADDLTGDSADTLQIGGRVGGFGGPLGLPGVLGKNDKNNGNGNGNGNSGSGNSGSGNSGNGNGNGNSGGGIDGDGNNGHGNNPDGCDPDNPGNGGKKCGGGDDDISGDTNGNGNGNSGNDSDGDGNNGHGNNDGGCDPDNPGNSGKNCNGGGDSSSGDSGGSGDSSSGSGSGSGDSGSGSSSGSTGSGSSQVDGNSSLCTSASPVPNSLDSVKGQLYQSSSADWSGTRSGGWRCLSVSMSGVQRFQYGYDVGATGVPTGSAPSGADETFAAWARGDLDGDGRNSWFVLNGASFDGRVVPAPAVTIIDEGE